MLAFWIGGAAAPVAGGSGTLIFPEFEIDGTGTFQAWFRPSHAVLVFPQFRLRGVARFFVPLEEEPPCIPCINRQILVSSYGWGVLDLSTQFSFDPCGLGEDEPPIIVSSNEPIISVQDIERERLRAERARDNAIARQITRDSDPFYVAPSSIPVPITQKSIPIERLAFEINITRVVTMKVTGNVRALSVAREWEPISEEIIIRPQPVIKPEAEPKKAEPIIAPVPFEITPVKAKQLPTPGKITPLKVPEKPKEKPEEVVVPPKPVVKPEVEPRKESPSNIRHHAPMTRIPRKRR